MEIEHPVLGDDLDDEEWIWDAAADLPTYPTFLNQSQVTDFSTRRGAAHHSDPTFDSLQQPKNNFMSMNSVPIDSFYSQENFTESQTL